tara:strand:- start:83 stop:292 length:210 start_codon:yes stop_codon:yes gene_type:complete
MFKMFAVICAVTVLECNRMYEDPPRTFDTIEECKVAIIQKEQNTRDFLTDEDGYLTVAHLEVGCETVYN